MNEKNLELSDLTPLNNTDQRLSLTKGQTHKASTSSAEGEILFNLSDNPTSITKYTHTRHQTMFSNINSKNSEKKLKCYFFTKNLKKLKENFKSFINSMYCLKGKNTRIQVCITYIIFLIIMALIIIFFKLHHVLNILNSLADKKYFLFYVNNIIDSQREIKVQLDELNNHDIIAVTNEPLLFLRIYTEEMVSHQILKNDSLKLDKNLTEIYKNLGENFILSKDLNELAEINEEGNSSNLMAYNINNMIPFYYHFSPILIESLNSCGIKLNNFYFIANDINNNDAHQEQKINSMYFKYPLENLQIAPDVPQENNKIYDFILDPYIDSTFDFQEQDEIIHSIRQNNWFYNCIQNNDNHFRIVKINKLSEEKTRKDYLMVYTRSNNLTYLNDEGNEYKAFFTFSMKINQNDDDYPFIELNKNDDILYFDYLSIYNFIDDFNQINIQNSNVEQSFEIDYDLDAGKNILIRIPKFIANMHTYSMVEKNKPRNKDQSKLLKYDEMIEPDKYYETNYYFQKDTLIFRLIYFLNEFFAFKKNHQEYLTAEYDSLSASKETSSDHPCNFQGYDEYYEKIKSEYDYDCLDDFCLYNNCEEAANNLEDLHFMSNCYCIPLFCRDSLSTNSEFHEELKEKILDINSEMSDNAYSFTSTYKDYLIKKEYNFSKIDQYFDRKNFIFHCKLSFGQKNNSYNNFFNTKIKIQNLSYKSGDNNFLMFFMNNNMTSFIVSNLKHMNYIYFYCILGGYIFFLICTFVILVKYILVQMNNLLGRMEEIKKIRATLIKNEEEKINYDELNSSNNNISNLNESEININDDNISVKSNESINKKKKNEDKKQEEKSIVEMDELDTLIKLINENLEDFQIKFNLNEDMNGIINEIKKQYNGIIKINQYKNKLLHDKRYENNSFEDEESNITSEEKEKKFDNLSLKMFYELLSTSTSEMDFSNIKRNFYYRKHDGKLLFGLEDILPYFNDEDSNGNGEITNLSKIQNAINYFYKNIHHAWERHYENMKKEEELNI